MINIIPESEITCPECGCRETLVMPTDACMWFHKCAGCHVLLKPLKGDCCVFCSYGTVPCPPIQRNADDQTPSGSCCDAN